MGVMTLGAFDGRGTGVLSMLDADRIDVGMDMIVAESEPVGVMTSGGALEGVVSCGGGTFVVAALSSDVCVGPKGV